MRRDRQRGTGLIFSLLFFTVASSFATLALARTATHTRALRWREEKLAALAIAEAGIELAAATGKPRLAQPFGRGRFVAAVKAASGMVLVTCRGEVPAARGGYVAVVVRARGQRREGRFACHSQQVVPSDSAEARL